MKQDLATAYRSNEEPKYQNKKESVEADPRSKTRKEKITGITGLTLWVFFFYLRLSPVQRYGYYQKSRGFIEIRIS